MAPLVRRTTFDKLMFFHILIRLKIVSKHFATPVCCFLFFISNWNRSQNSFSHSFISSYYHIIHCRCCCVAPHHLLFWENQRHGQCIVHRYLVLIRVQGRHQMTEEDLRVQANKVGRSLGRYGEFDKECYEFSWWEDFRTKELYICTVKPPSGNQDI